MTRSSPSISFYINKSLEISNMENVDRVREMIAIRDELTRLWKLSPFYAEQVEFFESTIFKLNDLRLDSALSMSIGRMSNTIGIQGKSLPPGPWGFDRGYSESSLNSLVELVIFESFIGILRIYPTTVERFFPGSLTLLDNKFDIPNNRVYFQEPEFHQVDIDFVKSLGYRHIRHPMALEVISPTTFIFGVYVYKDLVGDLFGRAIPGLAVLTPLEVPTISDRR